MLDNRNSFFSLSFAERKGIIVLAVILVLITAMRLYIVNHQNRKLTDPVLTEIFLSDSVSLSEKSGPVFLKGKDRNKSSSAPTYIFKNRSVANYNYFNRKSIRTLSDINVADSEAFVRLYGIGPVLSRRIIRYRQLLGGYYDISQLVEVYGLSDTLLPELSSFFFADTATIIKININHDSLEVLARHPYIGRYTAQGIIHYRIKAGRIMELSELVMNGILTQEQFERVKNYLVI